MQEDSAMSDVELLFLCLTGLGFVVWAMIINRIRNRGAKARSTPLYRPPTNQPNRPSAAPLPRSYDSHDDDRNWQDPNEAYERWRRQYDEEQARKATREAEHDAWRERQEERQAREEQMREEAHQEREQRNAQLEAEREERWQAAQALRERLETEREERWQAEQERREQLDAAWRRKHGFDEDD